MNHEEVKKKLLSSPETKEAYQRLRKPRVVFEDREPEEGELIVCVVNKY